MFGFGKGMNKAPKAFTGASQEEYTAAPEVTAALQELISSVASESFSEMEITPIQTATIASMVAGYFAKNGNPLTEEKITSPEISDKIKAALSVRAQGSTPVQTVAVDEQGFVVGTNLTAAQQAEKAEQLRESHYDPTARN